MNPYLKYEWLNDFDRDMVAVTKENRIFGQRMSDMRYMSEQYQACAFLRNGLLFVFNFHHSNSLKTMRISVPNPGTYSVILSSDDKKYGGFENVEVKTYITKTEKKQHFIEIYAPARTCFVLKEKANQPLNKEIQSQMIDFSPPLLLQCQQ